MEQVIEQTLSKPTLQLGLRIGDYLVLFLVATIGSFFVSKFWLVLICGVLIFVFRAVNKSEKRFLWSSIYLWAITNRKLDLQQTQKLPPIFKG